MNRLFQYAKSIESYDRRFPDNSHTIVNVRYSLMHCHVNNNKIIDKDLMLQDEELFGSLDLIKLESKYLATIKLKRKTAVPKPSTPISSATKSITSLPPNKISSTAFKYPRSSSTTIGLVIFIIIKSD